MRRLVTPWHLRATTSWLSPSESTRALRARPGDHAALDARTLRRARDGRRSRGLCPRAGGQAPPGAPRRPLRPPDRALRAGRVRRAGQRRRGVRQARCQPRGNPDGDRVSCLGQRRAPRRSPPSRAPAPPSSPTWSLLDAGTDSQPWACCRPVAATRPILVDRVGAGLDTRRRHLSPGGAAGDRRHARRPVAVPRSAAAGDADQRHRAAVRRPARATQLEQRWAQDERYLAADACDRRPADGPRRRVQRRGRRRPRAGRTPISTGWCCASSPTSRCCR